MVCKRGNSVTVLMSSLKVRNVKDLTKKQMKSQSNNSSLKGIIISRIKNLIEVNLVVNSLTREKKELEIHLLIVLIAIKKAIQLDIAQNQEGIRLIIGLVLDVVSQVISLASVLNLIIDLVKANKGIDQEVINMKIDE